MFLADEFLRMDMSGRTCALMRRKTRLDE